MEVALTDRLHSHEHCALEDVIPLRHLAGGATPARRVREDRPVGGTAPPAVFFSVSSVGWSVPNPGGFWFVAGHQKLVC
ncbi:hypothetical protein SAMN05216228_10825 [Rhizobium tibeticum]|uniref:Uncharacterized protein n=1 Tax=Rhizobium tibeticum TaxID=501024 RepID=A0A1H8WW92_9HYPH|nr:hypothetical protein RTCCBAU85039_6740 [Rhizobium tibeticum]SEP31892.1 hypothetical protein SAMN05216228_10825 [Rhizobium tibeticum]